MKSMRMALLAAAVLAVVPASAYAADRQDRPDRDQGDRGNRGNNGNNGNDHARPAPPQGQQRGSGMMVAPRAPDGARSAPQQAPQAQPQFRPQAQGGWQGQGWRGPGAQGRGDVRGDVHVDRPASAPNADTGQARADWRDRGNNAQNGGRPNDDRRGDNANRGQWSNGDNRPNGGNDHRWDNNNNNHGQWNGDHRGDGRPNAGGNWNGNHNGAGRPGGNDHRWNPGRWRNDHRYDWRDWRTSHRNLFSRHYYAPRGYNYRSVYAGFFLEPLFYGSSYWLDDPYDYRLPPVQWPLQWVHYYNDALLVDVTTGEVVDVIPNFFY